MSHYIHTEHNKPMRDERALKGKRDKVSSTTMMVLVVELHYNYILFDHVMTSLYALHPLHALPLAFHALPSIVVEVETPCFHLSLLNHPPFNFKKEMKRSKKLSRRSYSEKSPTCIVVIYKYLSSYMDSLV